VTGSLDISRMPRLLPKSFTPMAASPRFKHPVGSQITTLGGFRLRADLMLRATSPAPPQINRVWRFLPGYDRTFRKFLTKTRCASEPPAEVSDPGRFGLFAGGHRKSSGWFGHRGGPAERAKTSGVAPCSATGTFPTEHICSTRPIGSVRRV
jgi:hypothetical protein